MDPNLVLADMMNAEVIPLPNDKGIIIPDAPTLRSPSSSVSGTDNGDGKMYCCYVFKKGKNAGSTCKHTVSGDNTHCKTHRKKIEDFPDFESKYEPPAKTEPIKREERKVERKEDIKEEKKEELPEQKNIEEKKDDSKKVNIDTNVEIIDIGKEPETCDTSDPQPVMVESIELKIYKMYYEFPELNDIIPLSKRGNIGSAEWLKIITDINRIGGVDEIMLYGTKVLAVGIESFSPMVGINAKGYSNDVCSNPNIRKALKKLRSSISFLEEISPTQEFMILMAGALFETHNKNSKMREPEFKE